MAKEIVQGSNPLGRVNIDLDKNDVLVVAVHRAEKELNRLRQFHTDAANQGTKDAQALEKKIREAHQGTLRAEYQPRVDALEVAVKAIDHRQKVVFTLQTHLYTHQRGSVTDVSIVVTKENGCSHHVLNQGFPLPEVLHEELARLTRITEQVAEDKRLAVDARIKANNIPMLERQFRAELVIDRLRNTDGGDELLALVTQGLDEAMKALPGA